MDIANVGLSFSTMIKETQSEENGKRKQKEEHRRSRCFLSLTISNLVGRTSAQRTQSAMGKVK